MSTARLLTAAAVAALALPLGALAAPSDDEVRVRGTCSAGASSQLRVREDDGLLRVELRIETRPRASWSVVLLHERRIVYRGTVRASSSGSARVRRSVSDLFGTDVVVARATGPRNAFCRVQARL